MPGSQPAPDVPVRLHRPDDDSRTGARIAQTDSEGTARFEGVTGTWEVDSVLAAGAKKVQVRSDEWSECVLDIAVGFTVLGMVEDSSGTAVARALIEGGVPLRGGAEVVATSRDDGSFILRGCPSPFLVGARAEGFASSGLYPAAGSSGEVQRLRIVLDSPGGSVEGIVRDGRGMPVADAVVQIAAGRADYFVSLSPHGPPLPAEARSDPDGKFRAIGVPIGNQPVQVQAAGFAPYRSSFEVVANAITLLNVTLDAGTRCEGAVFDAGGAPAANVAVQIGNKGEFFRLSTRTDDNGRFSLESLPAAEVCIRASDPRRGRAQATILLVAFRTTRCDLRLSTGRDLRGRVVDEVGRPVPGVEIQVVVDVDGLPAAKYEHTDADGRFCVQTLPDAGRVTVVADGDAIDKVIRRDVDPAAGELLLCVRRALGGARIRGVLVADRAIKVGTKVLATCKESGLDAWATVVPGGGFDVGPLAAGVWRLSVQAKGYAHYQSPPIRVSEDATVDVGNILLHRGGTVRVTLTGTGAERASTSVCGQDGKPLFELSGGRSEPLEPGSFTLSVGGRGIAAQSVPFVIRDGEETLLEIPVGLGTYEQFEFQLPDQQNGVFYFEIHRGGARVLTGLAGQTKQGCVAQRWLVPGDYLLVVDDCGLQANVPFTVGADAGPPVVVPVRR
jgi:5-hydroxyisourate hydrolase-like protein (transthyretin family)